MGGAFLGGFGAEGKPWWDISKTLVLTRAFWQNIGTAMYIQHLLRAAESFDTAIRRWQENSADDLMRGTV